MNTLSDEQRELIEWRMLLFRVSHAQRQLLHPYMASIGLGTGQPKLLSYLMEFGPSAPCAIAEYYALDPAGVSRMLDTLSRKGLVTFAPAENDRRSKVVSLTPEGERVAYAWNAACVEEASAMLEGFLPEERRRFADYLKRAHANLKAYGTRLDEERSRTRAAREDAGGVADRA